MTNDVPAGWSLAERRTRMVFGLISAIYAFYLFLTLYSDFAQYLNGTVDPPAPAWQFIYYFTNQSNILVMIWLVIFAVANLGSGSLAAKAQRAVNMTMALGLTIYMAVVFLIVSCVNQPFYTGAFEPVPTGSGLYVHVITPIMMLMFFLLYPWRGRASWRTVLAWMGYLIFYVVLVNIVGSQTYWYDGTRAYPYDFINPFNYSNVFMYILTILGLAVAVFVLGLGLLRAKQRFDVSYRPDHWGQTFWSATGETGDNAC